MTAQNLELSGAHDHDPAYDLIRAVSQGQGLRITRDGQLIATLTPARAAPGSDRSEDPPRTPLPTRAEVQAAALAENRQVVAAEIARHLGNMEAEIRRHREILAHYDHVFDLRLTAATSDGPATATEGKPA